jgi:hypothetical protein
MNLLLDKIPPPLGYIAIFRSSHIIRNPADRVLVTSHLLTNVCLFI